MENIGTGAGLAAAGFWLFIAATIAVGVWDGIRKRDAQHETLRRAIESGQPLDDELVNKLLSLTGNGKNLARDLKVGGLIFLSLAPGLVLMGYILSVALATELLGIMSAVAGLILCLSVGFLVAAAVVDRGYHDADSLDGINP